LQAFSITTGIRQNILLTLERRLSDVKISSTRYRSKSIDFLPQCLSWKHHGLLEYNGFEERKQIFRPLFQMSIYYSTMKQT
jgi:hypothetical protein